MLNALKKSTDTYELGVPNRVSVEGNESGNYLESQVRGIGWF